MDIISALGLVVSLNPLFDKLHENISVLGCNSKEVFHVR